MHAIALEVSRCQRQGDKLCCPRRNFVALLACVPLQRFIPLHQQILVPLGLTFAVLVLAAAVALWTSASGAAVILTMLPSVALMGSTTALLQGGLFGLAGLCPPIYVQVMHPLHNFTEHPRPATLLPFALQSIHARTCSV